MAVSKPASMGSSSIISQTCASEQDLLLESYDFELPEDLIASRPAIPRHKSKLLVYDEEKDEIIHTCFDQLPQYIPSDTALVLNQSKVFPCRLLGQKPSGGKAEVFILSLKEEKGGFECMIKTSKKKEIGHQFFFEEDIQGEVVALNNNATFQIQFNRPIEKVLDLAGKMPIPPYIRGGLADDQDLEDYQTTFAKNLGSVAAPTAGLHFTKDVFENLKGKNIHSHYVTLHVGLGTFAPVKSDNIKEHQMHSERFFVEEDWAQITQAPKRICVGTTSLRVLESLWSLRESVESQKLYDTDIFLYPGKQVESIHGLITNFHLPKSTLLMLVSSLIGREKTLELYGEAIKKGYRFFSYGDAMFIRRKGLGTYV